MQTKMISTAVVVIVLIMNVFSIFFYYKEMKRTGFILKVLADGISLVWICIQ